MTSVTSGRGSLPTAEAVAEILEAGDRTTVQDWPGRVGHRAVGVPPSGPMDDLALRIGNRIVGNGEGVAGLEIEKHGPTIRFGCDVVVCVAGAKIEATIDGRDLPLWTAVSISAGQVLGLGAVTGPGSRSYLLVRGGFDVPGFLGSRSTCVSSRLGGLEGGAVVSGDALPLGTLTAPDEALGDRRAAAMAQHYGHRWELRVIDGPHTAPEYFTDTDVESFYSRTFEVHPDSDRSGIRLLGPRPQWARRDGGDAGSHPSGLPDTAQGVGAVVFRGDEPFLVGRDGPGLAGFACPAVVIHADLWKIGQLSAGDKIAFRAVSAEEATMIDRERRLWLDSRGASERPADVPMHTSRRGPLDDGVLSRRPGSAGRPETTWRRSGDRCVLVEYGPAALDLELRIRVQVLLEVVEGARRAGGLRGILDVTPGVRSLQVHFDPARLPAPVLLGALEQFEETIGSAAGLRLATRTVHLPLCWSDGEATSAAARNDGGIARELAASREAPGAGLEDLGRANGLDGGEDVRRIVVGARHLVMGLGNPCPGSPVTAALDPRHRLRARRGGAPGRRIPEGTVGIAGACLFIQGMEGVSALEPIGRTVPVWDTRQRWTGAAAGRPWLLRFFDQIRFFAVEAEELRRLRRLAAEGRYEPRIDVARFDADAYHRFLCSVAEDTERFHSRQRAAFPVAAAASPSATR
ncbi:MAG: 5-oxoprolinase/urea amidolyase family protein [Candidatus Binatia bacterium]